jgi:hypothetical protein
VADAVSEAIENGATVSSSSTELAFQVSLPLPYLRTTFFPYSAYSFTLKTEVASSSERSGTICEII